MSLSLLQRLGPRCKTVNQVNSLLIALENRMTPAETAQIVETFRGDAMSLPFADGFAKSIAKNIEIMEAQLATAKKARAETFQRFRIAKNLMLFSNKDINKSDKKLLICFTGRAGRMNMALAPFLQHFDSHTVDVAVVVIPSRDLKIGYRRGFCNFGPDVFTSVDRLAHALSIHAYKSASTFGTSAGAIVAILATLQLRLEKAIACTPTHPNDPFWEEIYNKSLEEELIALQAYNEVSEIITIYHPLFGPDVLSADALAKIIKLRAVTVNMPKSFKGNPHMVLGYAMIYGVLDQILNATLYK